MEITFRESLEQSYTVKLAGHAKSIWHVDSSLSKSGWSGK